MMNAPKTTLLLMSYRQAPYVVEALRACLAQQDVQLEIIASDDASNDGTFESMQAESVGYTGPHRLLVRRNASNMGMIPHLNLLMTMATGDRIVIAAGDDVPHADRVAKLMQVFDSSADIFAVYSNAVCVTPEGATIGLLYNDGEESRDRSWQRIAQEGTASVTGCGLAWRREVFDLFGPLALELKAEDQAIPFRAALLGEIAYCSESLLDYRQSPHSLSYWRRYRAAFLRASFKDMRKFHLQMTSKNLGDVSMMYHDLLSLNSVENRSNALHKLKARVEQLELEQAVFTGQGIRLLRQSQFFRSKHTVRKLKIGLLAIVPSLFLVAKGALILWRKRSSGVNEE